MTTLSGGALLRDRLLEGAMSLPIADQRTLWKVADLCRDPLTDAREIALQAQQDEGFAAMLMRVANSAWSASSNRIGDLPGAVSRLGLGFVESLALATPGIRLSNAGGWKYAGPRRKLHKHAVRTGLAARAIAPKGIDPEQALVGGLVHNIGLSVIAVVEPDIFGRLLEVAEAGDRLCEFELEELGFTHAELGALLAERWGYPVQHITAIVDHDDDEAPGMTAVVRTADLLAREAGVGVEAPEPLDADRARLSGIDLDAARVRLAPLFQAVGRKEDREAAENDEPGASKDRDVMLAQALDAAV
jgi:HD-like signal output (HDOD) protein